MTAWHAEMRRLFASSPFNRLLGLELGEVGARVALALGTVAVRRRAA